MAKSYDWDGDPDLEAEAEELRREHEADNGNGDGEADFDARVGGDPGPVVGNGSAGQGNLDLPAWDAGEMSYDDIPPRGWLLGNSFCRGFLSGLISEGAVGKTALRMAQALAVVTGRKLTGEHVFVLGRVLLLLLEDTKDEVRRRLKAVMIHHRISRDDLRGRLFVVTLEDLIGPAKFAQIVAGRVEAGPLKQQIERFITAKGIDLVVIDPLKNVHDVNENNNTEMNQVAGLLIDVAIKHDCAVDAPYHATKGAPDPGNVDRGRGASSYKDAGRLVKTLSPISVDDAKKLEIDDDAERKMIRRIDDAKMNLAPLGDALLVRLVNVPLGNATETYPKGDHVQTVEAFGGAVDAPGSARANGTKTSKTQIEIDCDLAVKAFNNVVGRAAEAGALEKGWEHLAGKRPVIKSATWLKEFLLMTQLPDGIPEEERVKLTRRLYDRFAKAKDRLHQREIIVNRGEVAWRP